MKINYYQFFLIISCCFLFACQTDVKSTPAPISTPASTPVPAPVSGSVATPPDKTEPSKMVNNFQRMQGEWQEVDVPEKKIQVRGKLYVEVSTGKDRSELAKPFKVVKDCEGAVDMNGTFFMVGNRCFKLLKISIEEMEVENLEQQKVVKYNRI